jgi:hypothetical protein
MTGDRLTRPAERPIPIPATWGRHLDESDYAAPGDSWITRDIPDAVMLRRVDDQQGREAIGQKSRRNCAGILFPYYLPDQSGPVNYRLRRDQPDRVQGKNGELKESLLSTKSGRRSQFAGQSLGHRETFCTCDSVRCSQLGPGEDTNRQNAREEAKFVR